MKYTNKTESSRKNKIHIPRARPWLVPLAVLPRPKTAVSSSLILIAGFAGLIVIGTFILMLPISSKAGQSTPFINALFTATSAVCVTGLVIVDTGSYWSSFGQGVILALIQIGGFGFMTSATLFLIAFGRRIGLRERLFISESMGIVRMGGLIRIIKRMVIFSLIVELAGAILFYIRFSTTNTEGMSIWLAIFHAVSSFNNAGFDIFMNFKSLSDYKSDSLILLVTAALIFLGGISFLVLMDLFKARSFARLSLDSKLILTGTIFLLALGTIVTLFTEYNGDNTFKSLTLLEKLLNSFFLSVTARTAGFSTLDVKYMADYTLSLLMVLMLIGGASGSTAGGIKVNSFGILAATIWSTIRGKEHPGAFGREFANQQIFRALSVAMLSLSLVSIVVFLLTVTEEFRFINLLFEAVSAFGTVGLSTGITPDLSTAGRLIIVATMFAGRLGPLTLALALVQRQHPTTYRYPDEMVRIG